jgi:hypothetical protein
MWGKRICHHLDQQQTIRGFNWQADQTGGLSGSKCCCITPAHCLLGSKFILYGKTSIYLDFNSPAFTFVTHSTYWAARLALFQPWGELPDLKGPQQLFEDAFKSFWYSAGRVRDQLRLAEQRDANREQINKVNAVCFDRARWLLATVTAQV